MNVQSWLWLPALPDAMAGLLRQGDLTDLSIESRQPWGNLGSRLHGIERGRSPESPRPGQKRGSQ